MTKTPHRPSQREVFLEAALDLIRAGGSLSMDSVARAAGITKPGLMYHFRTKVLLLEALVDHLIDGYEHDLGQLLPSGLENSTVEERLEAYLVWGATYVHDAADLVMLSDSKFRIPMSARWADRFRVWVEIPAFMPARRRARLNAVRLLADGCWYSEATGILPLPADDRLAVMHAGLELLRRDDS